MSVQRYRRKPERPDTSVLFAARYEPGQPLDDVARVARMASNDADVAEAPLPSGTVLVARYRRYHDEHPSEIDYEVVAAGDYLTYTEGYGGPYTEGYGGLCDSDDADLRQWYEAADG